jgi:hypothetical protein
MTSEETKMQALLEDHAAQCADCQASPLPLGEIEALLASEVPLDPAALSCQVLDRLRPELAGFAAAVFRRRVAAGLLVALAPLPLVLAFNAYVLSAVYALVALIVPSGLAAYLVLSYAAAVLLLLAATYGSIPLLVAKQLAIDESSGELLVRNA